MQPDVMPERPPGPEMSAVGKRTFFRIMDLWGVDDNQARLLIGSPSRATFYTWKKGGGGKVSRDTLDRIGTVIGIFKALEILFADPSQADAWVSKPNDAFGGQSALDRMAGGSLTDLHAVRSYLDYVRGGGS